MTMSKLRKYNYQTVIWSNKCNVTYWWKCNWCIKMNAAC